MSDVLESSYSKVPTFDGERDSWTFYKKKMESYLARKDLALLLQETVGSTVEKDDAVIDLLTDAGKKKDELRAKNRKAAGILLDSIDTTTSRGKAAFHLIEKFHDVDSGYAGGHFYNEWQALTKRYEVIEEDRVEDLLSTFYSMQMGIDQQPSLFLVEMEQLRTKLKKKGHTLSDEEFVKQILTRLPKGTERDKMGPYQVARRFIEAEMKPGTYPPVEW